MSRLRSFQTVDFINAGAVAIVAILTALSAI